LKASPSLFTHTLPRARSIRQHEYVFLKAGLKFSKKAFQQRWKLSVNKEFIQVKIPIILDFAIHFFLLIKTACWLPEVVSREDRETLTRLSGGRIWLQKKIGSFSQGSIPVIFISCTCRANFEALISRVQQFQDQWCSGQGSVILRNVRQKWACC
jgi:hypothetical protein